MDSLDYLELVIDPKIYKILKLFLDNKKNTFHLNIISQQTNVPIASTFRIVNRLIRYDIVSVIKKGKLNVYRFNKLDEVSLIKLIDPKTYKILRLFLDNKEELFLLNKISSLVNVPIASTFRIMNELIRLNIVMIILVGKTKFYKLSSEYIARNSRNRGAIKKMSPSIKISKKFMIIQNSINLPRKGMAILNSRNELSKSIATRNSRNRGAIKK